jgi:hypothetical protein
MDIAHALIAAHTTAIVKLVLPTMRKRTGARASSISTNLRCPRTSAARVAASRRSTSLLNMHPGFGEIECSYSTISGPTSGDPFCFNDGVIWPEAEALASTTLGSTNTTSIRQSRPSRDRRRWQEGAIAGPTQQSRIVAGSSRVLLRDHARRAKRASETTIQEGQIK